MAMLPPHYKFPPRHPWHLFLRRLLSWRQIDWDSTFTQVLFAVLYPSKLALMASHRLQTQGQLARGDPGVFLCVLYLAAFTSLPFGCALVGSHLSQQDDRGFQTGHQRLQTVFWGFIVWPLVLIALLTLLGSLALFLLLRHFASLSRRSFAATLAQSMQPAVNLIFDHTSSESSAPLPVAPTLYSVESAYIDWAYCFDLICNGILPSLFVLCALQYLFLPVLLAKSFSGFVGVLLSNTLHVMASFMFVYNVAAGVAILKAPLWRVASMLFAPLSLWLLILIILTIFKINLSTTLLQFLFAPFLPVD